MTVAERPLYVGVSAKAYLGYRASVSWMTGIEATVASRPGLTEAGVVPFVVPSFPVLESAMSTFGDGPVLVGAQDVSDGEGPRTGEVSAGMLAEMGVRIVEIGHAERRLRHDEDDEIIAAKVEAAVSAGLTPLLCVGEFERSSAEDAAASALAQCRAAVEPSGADLDRLIVAYEPVWAIGAAEPAPTEFVDAVVAGIRAGLGDDSDAIPAIIYGGSAGPGLLPTLTEVDGLFLGRFAHDPDAFGSVLDDALEARGRAGR